MSLKRRMSRLMHNAKALSLAPYYPHMSAHAVDVAEYEARQDGARRRYEAVASGLTTAERLTGHFIRDVPITSFGVMSPARARVLEDELTKTTTMRELVDNAVTARASRLNEHLWGLVDNAAHTHPSSVVTSPGGNPMASRKKAAPRRRMTKAQRAKAQQEIRNAQNEDNAQFMDELTPKRPTIAEQLAAPDKPNTELESVAQFVAVFMLSHMGFTFRELGELLQCSSSAAGDMVKTGATIADRNGLTLTGYDIGARMRAMRENASADWALKAAHGMQELIASALPAFIRASSTPGEPCTVDVKKVVDLVEHFSATDDVVERSNLAQRIRRELDANGPQNGCAADVERAGELQAAEAYRGAYAPGTAGYGSDRVGVNDAKSREDVYGKEYLRR